MPIYDYICDDNDHVFEAISKLADREYATCTECGSRAKSIILQAAIIDPRMGVDPGFPKAAAKWEKKQWLKATGRMKDSNQAAYGTTHDVERDAHRMRKERNR